MKISIIENLKEKINPIKQKRAEKIRDAIETRIGFNGDLVKYGVGCSGLWTSPNASFGLLDYVLGNKKRAEKIRDTIKTRIGFEGDLVKNRSEDSGVWTERNSRWGL